MHPQLVDIIRQIDEASAHARRIAAALDAGELARRPHGGGWSVAECLNHLTLCTHAELAAMDAALTAGPNHRRQAVGDFKMDWKGRLLTWALEPPPRFWSKMKTTAVFEPVDAGAAETALSAFLDGQQLLKDRVQSVDGLAIDTITVISPFDKRVSYNLFSFFNLLLAHERRHLWQAEEARTASHGTK